MYIWLSKVVKTALYLCIVKNDTRIMRQITKLFESIYDIFTEAFCFS